MSRKLITVSKLKNITFYTGADAENCGINLENRNYGYESDIFGRLSLNSEYNSYWKNIYTNEDIPFSIFAENPTKYNHIGDIIDSTITYINKYKNNNVDIQINKNILTFKYNYEADLEGNFENTKITPASDLINLLTNVNDMIFNKKAYYKNNYELLDVTYARKKYPYRKDNTILNIIDENNNTIEYNFSKQFVDYNYIENENYNTYTRSYMIPFINDDGTTTYIPDPVNTYTETVYYYTYEIYDINRLTDRINLFFENNSNKINDEYGDLKTYYIGELDTIVPLTLNTYSLSSKNLYSYFVFTSKYDNWFYNCISFIMNTNNLDNNSKLLDIEPIKEETFNIITNDHDKPCGDNINTSELHTFNIEDNEILEENPKFKIINPSNIKKIDLSENIDKITKVDLNNQYRKKTNVNDFTNTTWFKEYECNLESLILGNENKNGIIEEIIGLNNITTLKELNIINCNNLKKDFSINKLGNLTSFNAKGSNIKNFVPKSGCNFEQISLPDTLTTLTLKNINIDNFDYEPTSNLINVNLSNVTGNGLNTQTFIENWINELSNTNSINGDNKLIYDGLITNTNLEGINWNNFDVDKLLKFKYLGLNKFSGQIDIKGNGKNNTLTRKEYVDLIDVFGPEIMKTWGYTTNTKNIKFNYSLDNSIFKKNIYIYYYDNINERWDIVKSDNNIYNQYINIFDNFGGNKLLDLLDIWEENKAKIPFKLNDEEFGYEYKLTKKISINNKNALTSDLIAGDIVLYKGDKIIFVKQNITSKFKYIKLGTFNISSELRQRNPMMYVSFNLFENDNIEQITNEINNLPNI